METIEERAERYACFIEHGMTAYDGYIKGATDQRKIDIQRAVEWLSKRYVSKNSPIMQEFIEYMKGCNQ